MKTKPFYLVIGTGTRTARRVTQRWPMLDAGEIIVRLTLDIPDTLLPHAAVIELEIEDPESVGVAVEAEPLEAPA